VDRRVGLGAIKKGNLAAPGIKPRLSSPYTLAVSTVMLRQVSTVADMLFRVDSVREEKNA
jgi:hypothetical protein